MADHFNKQEYESVQKDIFEQVEDYRKQKQSDLDYMKGALVKFYNDQYNNLKDLCCVQDCNGSPEYADSSFRIYCVNHKENAEDAIDLKDKINNLKTEIENTFEKLAFCDGLISLFDQSEQEKKDVKFSKLESMFMGSYKFINDAKAIRDLYPLEEEMMAVYSKLENFKIDLCKDLELNQNLIDKIEKGQPLIEEHYDEEINRGNICDDCLDDDVEEDHKEDHKNMYNQIIFVVMFLTMGMLCFLLYSKLFKRWNNLEYRIFHEANSSCSNQSNRFIRYNRYTSGH
jgi:hypothetical protein